MHWRRKTCYEFLQGGVDWHLRWRGCINKAHCRLAVAQSTSGATEKTVDLAETRKLVLQAAEGKATVDVNLLSSGRCIIAAQAEMNGSTFRITGQEAVYLTATIGNGDALVLQCKILRDGQ